MSKDIGGLDLFSFNSRMHKKLLEYPLDPYSLMVNISNPNKLSSLEKREILSNIKKTNMSFFNIVNFSDFNKSSLLSLTNQLGLEDSDGNLCSDTQHISSIKNENKGVKAGYIPYSNKALTWHTDGYYNSLDKQIKGMVLYCVQPAKDGGESLFYDHERLFFELYKENPLFIKVLFDMNVLTIPENKTTKGHYRASQSGPVFLLNANKDGYSMRYSARSRNIEWGKTLNTSKGSTLEAALLKIKSLLSEKNPYVYKLKLKSGQGVVCNNVLHNRKAFEDNVNPRLFYRARFYNQIG